MPKSLLDHAFDFVSKSKEPVSFAQIWEYVKKEAGLDEETAARKVSSFYTNILLDGRFVTLGDNNWDLRSRQTFDKVHIDMKDVYSDVEENDDDEEEEIEEKEYNEAFDDNSEDKDELDASSEEEETL